VIAKPALQRRHERLHSQSRSDLAYLLATLKSLASKGMSPWSEPIYVWLSPMCLMKSERPRALPLDGDKARMTQKQKILLAFILPAQYRTGLPFGCSSNALTKQLAIERWSNEHRALVRIIAQPDAGKNGRSQRVCSPSLATLPISHPLRTSTASSGALNGIPPDLEPGKTAGAGRPSGQLTAVFL
jgi:hypothetical protein